MIEADFLREKFALFRQACGHPPHGFETEHLKILLEEHRAGKADLKKYEEAVMELFTEMVSLETAKAIYAQLRAKYGYHSLGSTPDDVLKKVLRRGSLKTEDEAYAIRNLVSNVEREKELGRETYKRLCEMVDRFEMRLG